jgi:hypothetical protein
VIGTTPEIKRRCWKQAQSTRRYGDIEVKRNPTAIGFEEVRKSRKALIAPTAAAAATTTCESGLVFIGKLPW